MWPWLSCHVCYYWRQLSREEAAIGSIWRTDGRPVEPYWEKKTILAWWTTEHGPSPFVVYVEAHKCGLDPPCLHSCQQVDVHGKRRNR